MRRLQPIAILPVLYHTDETTSSSRMGIDYSLADCEERPKVFYSIDSIGPYTDDNDTLHTHTAIMSGGELFICPLSFPEVRKRIENEDWEAV